MFEIERKYLIDNEQLSPLLNQSTESYRIRQGYLASMANGIVRIRELVPLTTTDAELKEPSYILTIKLSTTNGEAGVIEVEKALTSKEFEAMWPHAEQAISKIRHGIPLVFEGKQLTIELDCFQEKLAGLTMAEVECPDEDTYNALSAAAFEWNRQDVTGDPRYYNFALGSQGKPD